jgi:hypothetical protein
MSHTWGPKARCIRSDFMKMITLIYLISHELISHELLNQSFKYRLTPISLGEMICMCQQNLNVLYLFKET